MTRRSVRLGVALLATLGLTTTFVPPAVAEGTGTLTFRGFATLTGGLDAPCQVPTAKPCPPITTVNPNPSKKDVPFSVTGNTRTGAFTSNVCVATVVNGPGKTGNVTPGPKPATEGPDCTIASSFTLTGHCGLSHGRGTGTFQTQTPLVPSGTYRNVYWFNYTFVEPMPGTLVVRGNAWKTGPTKPSNPTQLSDLAAVLRARLLTPLEAGHENSCVTKTARSFEILGPVTFTHPKVQP